MVTVSNPKSIRVAFLGFQKSTLIKIHARACLSFSVVFALESFGIFPLPFMAYCEIMDGFALTPFTEYSMRLIASMQFFIFLVENEYAGDPRMSKLFDYYHIPLGINGVVGAYGASNPVRAFVLSNPSVFGILGFRCNL